MIGYPLAPVVAFLHPHGALAILDGAPFIGADGRRHSFEAADATPRTVARLYLGDHDLCPAAEGWVVRVLSKGEHATHINIGNDNTVMLMRGDRLLARWTWYTEIPTRRFFRERALIGPPPPTPAARVAAVLNHELRFSS